MPKQCLTCGGVYEPMLADGMRYFHACPPLRQAQVDRAGRVQWLDIAQVAPEEKRLAERDVARSAARNENVRQLDRDAPATITAAGTGIVDVAPLTVLEGK